MSIFFLPGTAVHEFSHYSTALLLQVQVGKMELVPKLEGNNLKLGSVQIAKSDPIRRFFIGAAPFLFGTTIILAAFFYAAQQSLFNNKLSVIVIVYIVFEIGNTMFSSKKDMEGAMELILVVLFIIILLYFVGVRLPAINPNVLLSNRQVLQTFQKTDLFLSAPIGIDIFFISILKIVLR